MFKKLAVTAVLLAALAGSAAAVAQPPHGGDGAIALLERLDLSDAQWLQVHKLMRQHRAQAQPLHQRERQLHKALALLDASSTGYAQQLQKLQDDAAQLARDRVRDFAEIKTEVEAILTPAQRAKLLDQAEAFDRHGPPPAD